jgi:hypothetical protein
MKQKHHEEYYLIEEARKVFSSPVTAGNATFEITREAVYINH